MNSMTKEEYDSRKELLENMKALSKTEKEDIFRILKNENEQFSENSNGIFFDVATIKKTTFVEILNMITLSKQKKQEQDERLKEMEKLREEVPEETEAV
jgi:hypothetical protein